MRGPAVRLLQLVDHALVPWVLRAAQGVSLDAAAEGVEVVVEAVVVVAEEVAVDVRRTDVRLLMSFMIMIWVRYFLYYENLRYSFGILPSCVPEECNPWRCSDAQ